MKRTIKEKVIFDNYDVRDLETAAQDYYDAMGFSGEDDPDFIEYTQSMFDDELTDDFDNFKWELNRLLESNSNGWILKGNLGLWNGNKAAGTVLFDLDKLSKIWGGSIDYLKVTERNGHLHFQCWHHDGCNEWELRKLTEKGYNYWNKCEEDLFVDPKEVHSTIFKSNFLSGLPHYVKNVWGA